VHEALDARLELDEGAVVRDGHDLAGDPRAHRVLGGYVLPGVALQLLEAKRNALALPVDVEHLDLELHADLHHFARVRDAAPRHVGDVEQAVDPPQIDEGAEVGDVLDHALPYLILRELLHELLALAGTLGLEDDTTGHHDVAAALVELDDLELVLLAEQFVDVRHPAERDLRARQEGVDAHEVDDHAALDLLDERPFDRLIALVGDANALPHAHEVGLLLGKDDRAFLVLKVLEEHLDFIARLEVGHVLELLERDRPFGLEADIEDDKVLADLEDTGLDDLAFLDRRQRPVVQLHHPLVLVGRELVLLVELGATVREGAQLALLLVALLPGGHGGIRRDFVERGFDFRVQLGAQFSAHTVGFLQARGTTLAAPRQGNDNCRQQADGNPET